MCIRDSAGRGLCPRVARERRQQPEHETGAAEGGQGGRKVQGNPRIGRGRDRVEQTPGLGIVAIARYRV